MACQVQFAEYSIMSMYSFTTDLFNPVAKEINSESLPSWRHKRTRLKSLRYHSLWAVDRYLKDFNRVRLCHQDGKDLKFISLATGLNKLVVNEYLKIIEYSVNNS